LRKSPSLADLIQAKLSQGDKVVSNAKDDDDNLSSGVKKESRAPVEKLKASNFPATLLRIGSWEYISKHEGDLVAKCYFAKQKLVWEVLEDLIQAKLSQGDKVVSNAKDDDDNLSSGVKKESRAPVEKLKASNFPATLLRIGSWEYISKHEGDLVAKCYFAKQKLVWEVLE
ncbi:hypothetical protein RYX36_030228, partial [Vicia faba]